MQNDSSQHTVQYLYDLLDTWNDSDYPAGVQRIRAHIAGLAFFPGGAGLWTDPPEKRVPPETPLPVGKIMVLGHNFDSVVNYQKSLANRTEDICGNTWRPLLILLKEGGIAPDNCFFTNAYMGLKEGKATGPLPKGPESPGFFDRCCMFLLRQIQAQQPRLILTLGTESPRVLCCLAPELAKEWQRALPFRALDEQKKALIYPVRFADVHHDVAVVSLLHPSFHDRNKNNKRNPVIRKYNGKTGDDAETALVGEGWRLAQADASE